MFPTTQHSRFLSSRFHLSWWRSLCLYRKGLWLIVRSAGFAPENALKIVSQANGTRNLKSIWQCSGDATIEK